jgi:hypothetical protein
VQISRFYFWERQKAGDGPTQPGRSNLQNDLLNAAQISRLDGALTALTFPPKKIPPSNDFFAPATQVEMWGVLEAW